MDGPTIIVLIVGVSLLLVVELLTPLLRSDADETEDASWLAWIVRNIEFILVILVTVVIFQTSTCW